MKFLTLEVFEWLVHIECFIVGVYEHVLAGVKQTPLLEVCQHVYHSIVLPQENIN